MRRSTAPRLALSLAAGLLVLTGCSSDENSLPTAPSATAEPAAPSADATTGSAVTESGPAAVTPLPEECTSVQLLTKTPRTLTIATSEPAYEPWMLNNDPTNGQGLESAVAYAVAERLGFNADQVSWVRVGFDEAISPAPKDFDFDINQFTITPERAEAVDFSSGYYDVSQTLITVAGSAIEGRTTLAELADAKLGAMLGTTSLDAIAATIAPTTEPAVFQDNALAAQALMGGQIDGLVVDLPTALYMTGAQLEGGLVVGQLPITGPAAEQLGLLLEKDSPMTACATAAVDALRTDGVLDALATRWIAGAAGAPVLG